MKNTVLLLPILILSGCGVSLSDINIKLGSGFYYYAEGPSQSFVYYSANSKDPSIDKIIIWPTVVDYEFDKNFVVLKQSPDPEIIRQNLIYLNKESEMSADSIIKNDIFFNKMLFSDTCYWIISKNKHLVFGAYNRNEFCRIKDSLKVELDF